MKNLLKHISNELADTAVMEMGVDALKTVEYRSRACTETFEENLIEVAFAEAADYDDIHEAILREHRLEQDMLHPDESQYGDNDRCFV